MPYLWIVSSLALVAAGPVLQTRPGPDDPQPVVGGAAVESCAWPTAVWLNGCSGTLVHPEVVLYAAHCGTGISSVMFGESEASPQRQVPVESCRAAADIFSFPGRDFAFCRLSQPQLDVPIVPVLMGCETDALVSGRAVVVVGFGRDRSGTDGIKREVTTTVNEVGDTEVNIGGGGQGSCTGDSGGPVFIKLDQEDDGWSGWRVFGVTSRHEGAAECGDGSIFGQMHAAMEWFEQEVGLDLTPCHDADGTWNPGPDCGAFPREPWASGGTWERGCQGGDVSGYSAACGEPFAQDPDADPPDCRIIEPSAGARFEADPSTGDVEIQVSAQADDGAGVGVTSVEIEVDGDSTVVAEPAGPYVATARLDVGVHELVAIAVDGAGNVGRSAAVEVVVEADDADRPGSSDGGSGSDGPGGDDAAAGEAGEAAGCTCTAVPQRPPLAWLLAAAFGFGAASRRCRVVRGVRGRGGGGRGVRSWFGGR